MPLDFDPSPPVPSAIGRWSIGEAAAWAARQPWRMGCNYTPASAANQLAFWQVDSFDAAAIERELGLAAGIGFSAVRVYLHDLLWRDDPAGLLRRLDLFLAIAERHGIATMPVLFDSCWDPLPRSGPQPAPRAGIHNSRWVQSPGAVGLTDRGCWARLEAYVGGVVGPFAADRRVLAWDVWNEPDNLNTGSYGAVEPAQKLDRVAELLPLAFAWARAAAPTQPLTSGLWAGTDWSVLDALPELQRLQIGASDVLSFHDYGTADHFTRRVASLAGYGRPMLCTEFMARPRGSTFSAILPLAKRAGITAFCWGFVAGATQTYLPWSSWHEPVIDPDAPWFHDVVRADGSPYDPAELASIRGLAGRGAE